MLNTLVARLQEKLIDLRSDGIEGLDRSGVMCCLDPYVRNGVVDFNMTQFRVDLIGDVETECELWDPSSGGY
ncbi:hypothetical protein ANCCEY_05020 [Ancylostoma ceylanicum]|uniref:Uncharacterized protein n=1 Tax=Ancylostoma ceylanicum TaxID=53326 RepID=A0A0D6LV39_9BILA|nr:hypothetical protein ANCCEY_05020 [Ancylostoma ceylanicum]